MGNGCIRNDSMFTIEYLVYGAHQEIFQNKNDANASPQLQVDIADVKFKGFQRNSIKIIPKYDNSFIKIKPGAISNLPLDEMKLGCHLFCIRIKTQNFVKYIFKDEAPPLLKYMWIRLLADLSFIYMGMKEVERFTKKCKPFAGFSNSIIDSNSEKQQQIAKSLKGLFTAQELYNLLQNSLKQVELKSLDKLTLKDQQDYPLSHLQANNILKENILQTKSYQKKNQVNVEKEEKQYPQKYARGLLYKFITNYMEQDFNYNLELICQRLSREFKQNSSISKQNLSKIISSGQQKFTQYQMNYMCSWLTMNQKDFTFGKFYKTLYQITQFDRMCEDNFNPQKYVKALFYRLKYGLQKKNLKEACQILGLKYQGEFKEWKITQQNFYLIIQFYKQKFSEYQVNYMYTWLSKNSKEPITFGYLNKILYQIHYIDQTNNTNYISQENKYNRSQYARGLLYRFKTGRQQHWTLKHIGRILLIHDTYLPEKKITKNIFKQILQKGKNSFSQYQVNCMYIQLTKEQEGPIYYSKFIEILDEINQFDSLDFKTNQYFRSITQFILQSQGIINYIHKQVKEKSLLNRSIISRLIKQLNLLRQEKRENFIDKIMGWNNQITLEYFFNKIRKINQFQKITKYVQNQHIKNYSKWQYFNSESKLDKEFEQKALNHLTQKLHFKEELIHCSLQKDIIDLAKYIEDYSLFPNSNGLANLYQKKRQLKKYLTPNDIIQGDINDCYFLAAMASLIFERPQMIYRLLLILKNPSHIYAARLFIQGKWQTLILDLQFPINKYREFCGVRPNNKIIWPMLLEKAYAKANGSYDNIHFGTANQGIQVLTGAPSIYQMISKTFIVDVIAEQCKLGSILTASVTTEDNTEKDLKKFGLVPIHQYTILDVYPIVNISGKELNFIKLRNPWGTKDMTWNGPWSISSQLWNEELREKFGYKLNPKDGSFFMCQKDFQQYFTAVNICQVLQSYKNTSLDLKLINDEFIAVRIIIKSRGKYSFTAYLKKRRQYPKDSIYKRRCSWLFLLKINGQKFNPVGSKCVFKDNNTLQHKNELGQGEYIMILKVKWLHKLQQQYRLASYGPQQIQMKFEQFNESYLTNYINIIPQEIEKKLRFDDNKNTFKKIQFYPDSGYGFIAILNQQQSVFDVHIKFGHHKQLGQQYKYMTVLQPNKFMTVLQPIKFPLHLQVASGQTVICKFIIINKFEKSAIQFSYSYLNNLEQ